jgi:hypothetical protein
MSSNRLRLIGIVLSAAWIAVIGISGLYSIGTEVRRNFIVCYRMQAEAKADPRCARADVGSIASWCALKDMKCRPERPLNKFGVLAALCLGPPALGWLFGGILQSRKRRRLM